MQEYLLGLDAGNTVIKAVIFDRTGRELAHAGEEGHSRMPSPGHVERDLGELWANARRVIRTCLDRAGIAAGDIAAIGCAGHGNGLYALDRAGEPLVGIQSLDTRATGLVESWLAEGVGERTYPIARQRPWPSQTPTLLSWLKRHRPELFKRIGTVFFSKDFVVNRLTGQRVSEVSDMSGAGLLDLAARRYDKALMEAYGLGDCMDLLPPLIESADIAGYVTEAVAAETGLAAGTPVIGGLFDVVANGPRLGRGRAAGERVDHRRHLEHQPGRHRRPGSLTVGVFMSSTFDRTRYMAIENERHLGRQPRMATCGSSSKTTTPPTYSALRRLLRAWPRRSSLPADDPLYHPYLHGSRLGRPCAGGLLPALPAGTPRDIWSAPCSRASPSSHRRHVATICARPGRRSRSAVTVGRRLAQQASGRRCSPTCSASRCRSRAAGRLVPSAPPSPPGSGPACSPTFPPACGMMTRPAARFLPDPGMASHYAGRYRTYAMITEAMRPVWRRMAGADGED
jgi:L-xylulokinase